MTRADDYLGDMPIRRQIDDTTAEQLLAGRAGAAGLEPLATVVLALREVARQPVPPSAGLAEQMAAGVFTSGPVYRYQPARPGLLQAMGRAAVTVVAAARRMSLAAKLIVVGVVAGSLSLGTAGFARTLPDPVQNGFERMVESVVPYQFPEKTAERNQVGETGQDPADGPADQPGEPGGQPPAETAPPDGADPTPEPDATPTPGPSPTADEDAGETDDEPPGNSGNRCERKPEKCEETG